MVAGVISTAACLTPLYAGPLISLNPEEAIGPVSVPESPVDLTALSSGDLLPDSTRTPIVTNAATTLPRGLLRPLPAVTETDTNTSLNSIIKETVRPVYNELAESGALESWHDLKETLGLSKNSWGRSGPDDDTRASQRPREFADAPRWQNPAQPAKSAAQTQLDRQYDAYLLQQLIDDVKPWLLGLIGVYALGYLTKLVFDFMQWKSARRRERHAQRARQRSAHRGHRSRPEH